MYKSTGHEVVVHLLRVTDAIGAARSIFFIRVHFEAVQKYNATGGNATNINVTVYGARCECVILTW